VHINSSEFLHFRRIDAFCQNPDGVIIFAVFFHVFRTSADERRDTGNTWRINSSLKQFDGIIGPIVSVKNMRRTMINRKSIASASKMSKRFILGLNHGINPIEGVLEFYKKQPNRIVSIMPSSVTNMLESFLVIIANISVLQA
jgi:hypothetical protein